MQARHAPVVAMHRACTVLVATSPAVALPQCCDQELLGGAVCSCPSLAECWDCPSLAECWDCCVFAAYQRSYTECVR